MFAYTRAPLCTCRLWHCPVMHCCISSYISRPCSWSVGPSVGCSFQFNSIHFIHPSFPSVPFFLTWIFKNSFFDSKVFMREETETTGKTIYHNIQPEMPENTLKHSECSPFFYVCDSTTMRACANVFQPACGLDFQFIIETSMYIFPYNDYI